MKVFEITMLFIGSIIGAGFATGAEIITFFNKFALPSWLIALCVGIAMFSIMSTSIFLYKHQRKTPHTISYIFLIFYFVFFVAMTAAVTQIAGVFVGLISLLVSALIVMFGFDKMTRINTFIVISIIIILFGICLPYIVIPTNKINTSTSHTESMMLWAFLYAGLNCFMFPELMAASAPKNKKYTLYLAAFITASIIACFVFMILTAVKTTATQDAIMPILAISQHPITFVVILLAILTSQYSALFALIQKTKSLPLNKNISQNKMLTLYIVSAFICSFLGFEKILNIGYPLIGAFICSFLLCSLLISLLDFLKLLHR